ncbi:hypothetical protein BDR05DRAFT_947641 [Suillus weaverae]|nr:hypothetical protein BDR05DRAFT_947641 [Suillus weaverae]
MHNKFSHLLAFARHISSGLFFKEYDGDFHHFYNKALPTLCFSDLVNMSENNIVNIPDVFGPKIPISPAPSNFSTYTCRPASNPDFSKSNNDLEEFHMEAKALQMNDQLKLEAGSEDQDPHRKIPAILITPPPSPPQIILTAPPNSLNSPILKPKDKPMCRLAIYDPLTAHTLSSQMGKDEMKNVGLIEGWIEILKEEPSAVKEADVFGSDKEDTVTDNEGSVLESMTLMDDNTDDSSDISDGEPDHIPNDSRTLPMTSQTQRIMPQLVPALILNQTLDALDEQDEDNDFLPQNTPVTFRLTCNKLQYNLLPFMSKYKAQLVQCLICTCQFLAGAMATQSARELGLELASFHMACPSSIFQYNTSKYPKHVPRRHTHLHLQMYELQNMRTLARVILQLVHGTLTPA